MDNRSIIINKKLDELSHSKFRSSFHLKDDMISYIDEKGLLKVKEHGINFIKEKLAPANPKNDGKQTPMRGHPVFIAQHACACCCRSCLKKWHGIAKDKELSLEEVSYIVDLLMTWINKEYNNGNK